MNKLIIVIIVFLTISIVENDAKKLKCSSSWTYKPRTCATIKFHLLPDWIREIEMKNIKSEQKKVNQNSLPLWRKGLHSFAELGKNKYFDAILAGGISLAITGDVYISGSKAVATYFLSPYIKSLCDNVGNINSKGVSSIIGSGACYVVMNEYITNSFTEIPFPVINLGVLFP